LERANIPVDKYYASEIDKYAITIAQKNYPNTIQLGDITKWQDWNIDFASIDIVTAGFPCQAWSVAGKQLGDKDERGALFWTTLDIISHIKKLNPKVIFLLENVKMKREFEEYISHHTEQSLGKVNKYLINSALISAQNRKRYYWTNIDNVQQPEDRGLLLKHILETFEFNTFNKKSDFILKLASLPYSVRKAVVKKIIELPEDIQIKVFPNQFIYTNHLGQNGTLYKDKSATLVTACSAHVVTEDMQIRKLTPVECERLQTLPDNYTEGISTTQRYKCLGNGWTVDVIAHIFKNIT
jgi:DNA (cytosine-5)-methyltransferase 1/DNA (cytosine-5)-methyltransferase 3A